MNNEKYLNNSGLSHYDTKIKDHIEDRIDTKSVKVTSSGGLTGKVLDSGGMVAGTWGMSNTTNGYTVSYQQRGAIIPDTKELVDKTYVDTTIGTEIDTAVDSKVGDLTTLTTTDKTDAVSAINEVKFTVDGLGEPYRLKDFSQTFTTALTIPSVTQDVANTSIPNVDITITGQEAEDFAIAGLLKYEVFDASGNRLNCFPVCSFSMDGQKTLRVRMMVGGPNSKQAKRISGAILLKHR